MAIADAVADRHTALPVGAEEQARQHALRRFGPRHPAQVPERVLRDRTRPACHGLERGPAARAEQCGVFLVRQVGDLAFRQVPPAADCVARRRRWSAVPCPPARGRRTCCWRTARRARGAPPCAAPGSRSRRAHAPTSRGRIGRGHGGHRRIGDRVQRRGRIGAMRAAAAPPRHRQARPAPACVRATARGAPACSACSVNRPAASRSMRTARACSCRPPSAAASASVSCCMPRAKEKLFAVFLATLLLPPALARAEDLAADQAAVALLQRMQLRERRAHRDRLGVAGIDAGHEGIDGVVQELAAQSPAHELGDRLLGLRPAPPR